jgi:hypothetical protein
MVATETAVEVQPWRPIFENVLIFEKKGGADRKFGIFGIYIGCPVL